MTTGAPTPTYPARPRRSRLRTFLPLGVAAWLVLEIWLLTVVAGASSGFTVFLLLLAGFVLGAAVIKKAGRRAFQNLNEALQRGGTPQSGGGNGLLMLGGLQNDEALAGARGFGVLASLQGKGLLLQYLSQSAVLEVA